MQLIRTVIREWRPTKFWARLCQKQRISMFDTTSVVFELSASWRKWEKLMFISGNHLWEEKLQKTETTKQSVRQWEIGFCITNCELYHKDTVEKDFTSIEKISVELQRCISKNKLLTTKILTKNIVMKSRKAKVLKMITKLLFLKFINKQIWVKMITPVLTTKKTFSADFKLSKWRSRGKNWWIFWLVLLSSKKSEDWERSEVC